MKECVEYLEKAVQAVSDDAVQHISDDLTVLGTTVEKTTDNLKRSVIDIFSRIQDAVEKGANVLVIDDLLATGGTVNAACKLLKKAGANVKASAFIIELTDLNGRKNLPRDIDVVSMISYEGK